MVFEVNIIGMFLQDCRTDGGIQANITKTDAESFSQLLDAVRKVKRAVVKPVRHAVAMHFCRCC